MTRRSEALALRSSSGSEQRSPSFPREDQRLPVRGSLEKLREQHEEELFQLMTDCESAYTWGQSQRKLRAVFTNLTADEPTAIQLEDAVLRPDSGYAFIAVMRLHLAADRLLRPLWGRTLLRSELGRRLIEFNQATWWLHAVGPLDSLERLSSLEGIDPFRDACVWASFRDSEIEKFPAFAWYTWNFPDALASRGGSDDYDSDDPDLLQILEGIHDDLRSLFSDDSIGVIDLKHDAGPYWGKKIVENIPRASIKAINKVLGPRFVTLYGTKQGTLVLGKQVLLAIGVGIGASGNHVFGRFVIKAARTILGPPPVRWDAQSGETEDDRRDD